MSQDQTTHAGHVVTHRRLAQKVHVIEITPENCRVIYEDGSMGFCPRSELISMAAIEADQQS